MNALFTTSKALVIGIVLISSFSSSTSAQITLPQFFSDHMVVQRQRPIRVWGMGNPGEMIRIQLHNRVTVTFVAPDGRWIGTLSTLEAGGPYEMSIRSVSDTVNIQDVMVGDVWFCAGQSNMEWPLKNSEGGNAAAAEADFPNIRFFEVPKKMATQPQTDVAATPWKLCTPSTAPDFSAIAFYYGKELHENFDVPIGLIEATWGGSKINTWMSGPSLLDDPNFGPVVAGLGALDLDEIQNDITNAITEWENSIDDFDLGLQQSWHLDAVDWASWPEMLIPRVWESGGLSNVDGVVWFKKSFTLSAGQLGNDILLSLGKIDNSDETYINGQLVGQTALDPGLNRTYTIPVEYLQAGQNTITIRVTDYSYVGGLLGDASRMYLQGQGWQIPLSGYWRYQLGTVNLPARPAELSPNSYPCLLFNGMISPFLRLGIKGVIWYHGESDTDSPYYYRNYFRKLIINWRQMWLLGDYPFLFAQLPNFRTPPVQPADSGWATLRESQASTLSLPKTGMAVTIDLGDPVSIHPIRKKEVAERLFNAAGKTAYNQNQAPQSPSYQSATIQSGEIIITFSNTGTGLQSLSGDGFLRGFAIAGDNGQFVWAQATIRNANQVTVFNHTVPNPKYVRYAWSDNPGPLDLVNQAGLPAAPFRTDFLLLPWQ
ncbi:MAG TPA: sialate O-acetylesterase [Saprospiraceae bacterium]|mgnify:CR=1 FL=1|nr:sialate O-acetylesterase [Saprospiraceae bacterium]HMQ82111.1 sialate O-acetylesterase [Saprospiraceae bacterium]